MRVFLLWFLVSSVLAATASGKSRDKVRFSLEINPSGNATQPAAAVWRAGNPVFLIITMTNHSTRTLHFALTSPALNYRAEVRDANGTLVPETENLRKIKENLRTGFFITGRNILVTLKPHESRQDTMEISYLYDLSHPGNYTIQLERDLPPELGHGVVKSNIITATITS